MKAINLNDSSNQSFLPLENDGLTYSDEQDANVLEDYLELRRKVFKSDPVTTKILKPNQGWNYENTETHVLTAKTPEGKCVGGAIIIISNPGNNLLPLESDEFQLTNLYPQFDLEHNSYAEFTHFIIDENYRDWRCSANIFRCIHNLCMARSVKYLFGTAPYDRARRNSIGLKMLKIGLTAIIEKQVELPYQDDWNGYQRFLLTVDISSRFEECHHSDTIKESHSA